MRVRLLPLAIWSWQRYLLLTCLIMLTLSSHRSYAVVAVRPVTSPYLRANDALNHMRVDAKGRFLAYIGADGLGLSLVDLKTKGIFKVSDAQIGSSFVWSPDGYRLLYREQSLASDGSVQSELKAYDTALGRSVSLDRMPYATGFLTLDPRDLRVQMLGPMGIHTRRLLFPGERLAKWQVSQRRGLGKWLATQQGVLWTTQGGLSLRRLADDETGVESFDLSTDGTRIAWATRAGRVYSSSLGKPPLLIGFGRDPRWHPTKPQLIYAGARMVGNKVIGYDLRLADEFGAGRFLTSTQFAEERWPQWDPRGHQIIYTLAKTTDVYVLDFKP